jgi:hypothetical protein
MYFIIKSLINRFQKEDKDYYQFVRKTLFKDSILLFILSYLIFVVKDQVLVSLNVKTQVFTNEPTF